MNTENKINKYNSEYYYNNIDNFKIYQINNKDLLLTKQKQHYLNNTDKFKQHRLNNKDKTKEYDLLNRDKINARRRLRYLEKKQKVLI